MRVTRVWGVRLVVAVAIAIAADACGSSQKAQDGSPVPGITVAPPTGAAIPGTGTQGTSPGAGLSGTPGTSTTTPGTTTTPVPAAMSATTVTGAAGSGGSTDTTMTDMSAAPAGMQAGPVDNMGCVTNDGNVGNSVDPSTGALVAPAAGTGVQITTTAFTLNPGQEVFRCYHAVVPINTEIDVSSFESVMSEGSHHFILYKNDTDTAPNGQLDNSGCTLGFDQRWVYASGSPHVYMKMPPGVAMVLAANQKLVFDMHYINLTQSPINASVSLNINTASGTCQKAASLVSFNTSIFIPPNGTQTVGGDCTPGAGANFFLMSTHTHKRGILATITRVLADGSMGEELVRTTDWEHPTARQWDAPYLTFGAGEKFHYSCSYMNDRASTVTVGTSAETNEMCMAITYYFPSSAGGSCI